MYLKTLGLALFTLLTLPQLQAQKTFPSDIQVKTKSNKTVAFSELIEEGKYVAVTFWATWCSPCKKELDNMVYMMLPEGEDGENWGEKYNLQVIAVSTDNARSFSKAKAMPQQRGWGDLFTYAFDDNSALIRQVSGNNSVPFLCLIDPDGNIIYQHTGYKEGDEFELEEMLQKASNK